MALFIIAINTLPFDAEGKKPGPPALLLRLAGLAAAAVLLAVLLQPVLALKAPMDLTFTQESVYRLAALLFGRYVFQFELLSLLVLSGIVGAVVAAKRNL